MKKGMLVLGVILLMSVGLFGCESGVSPPGSASPSSIAGVYVERLNPNHSLEIHSDGTFYFKLEDWRILDEGSWEVRDNELRLSFADSETTLKFKIEGNVLIGGGVVFVKLQ